MKDETIQLSVSDRQFIYGLKNSIENTLESNKISLYDKVQNTQKNKYTIQQLFNYVVEQYKNKQEQLNIFGSSVMMIINILIESNQKMEYSKKDLEDKLEQSILHSQKLTTIIEQATKQIDLLKQKIDELTNEIIEVNQQKQKFQLLYQQQTMRNVNHLKEQNDYVPEQILNQELVYNREQNIKSLKLQIEDLYKKIMEKEDELYEKEIIIENINKKIQQEQQKKDQLETKYIELQKIHKEFIDSLQHSINTSPSHIQKQCKQTDTSQIEFLKNINHMNEISEHYILENSLSQCTQNSQQSFYSNISNFSNQQNLAQEIENVQKNSKILLENTIFHNEKQEIKKQKKNYFQNLLNILKYRIITARIKTR